MRLTKEQQDIINSQGNIKINAVAGSGKTTTVIEYARTRPSTSKILYLAFNKSVKQEAKKKFTAQGIYNITVETAHSLAYKHIVFQSKYSVKPQSYKSSEIADILKLQANGEKHDEFIIANHVNKFLAYFCNSNKDKVQKINYLDTITDTTAQVFVRKYYDYILQATRVLLSKMNSGEIEIIHDFYLKKFQLSTPQLPYDYILFDEGQDASEAMLDVFLKQKATKVIVGDTHQQIYGWRYAVNSLEKTAFTDFYLNSSFRFGDEIANLANGILNLKDLVGLKPETKITGVGTNNEIKTKAIIARTNLGLLLRAIEYISNNKSAKNIYFEGNINSYSYAEEGTSLYDVLNLYNSNYHLIKDPIIKMMKDLVELEDYIQKTEDLQVAMMVEIVMKYGNSLPKILNSLKEKHVEDKGMAQMVFSTVHRCKGMEYDSVELVNDFITKDKLENILENAKDEELNLAKLSEEINLLYVAVTRSRNTLFLPEDLAPFDFTKSQKIIIMKEAESLPRETKKIESKKPQKKPNQAYQPWTEELDDELLELYYDGETVPKLALFFGRSQGAIRARIEKLESEDYPDWY